MNRALWAVPAVALLGTASVVGVIVASPGGEEVVVQQLATSPAGSTTAGASPSPSPAGSPTLSPAPSPSPASTSDAIPADWKSFEDSAFGISLRYPPDFQFKDLTSASPVGGVSERAFEFRSPVDPPFRAFTMSISSNSKQQAPEEWLTDFGVCQSGTIRQGAVDARSAIFCTYAPTGIPEAAVAFENSGKIFFISAVLSASEFEEIIGSIALTSSGN